MLAAYAHAIDADDPLRALTVGDLTPSAPLPDWVPVRVRAASLNHHDLWSLRGVGLSPDRLPMVLGCDAAGDDPDGNAVIVHAVITDADWSGEETLDPRRSLLSERYPGTLAERVWVPRRNLVPLPPELSYAEGACLPTAWLTAYKMIFVNAAVRPGDAILVQGAGGGVASAAIMLGHAAGLRVYATSRSEDKRARAVELGAVDAVEPGARLPQRVDAVIETVGAATWAHSLRSLRPGGTVVVAGATSGDAAPAELSRVFFLQQRIIGSTMGNRSELVALASFLATTGLRPLIDRTLPLADVRAGLAAMITEDVFGKIVIMLD